MTSVFIRVDECTLSRFHSQSGGVSRPWSTSERTTCVEGHSSWCSWWMCVPSCGMDSEEDVYILYAHHKVIVLGVRFFVVRITWLIQRSRCFVTSASVLTDAVRHLMYRAVRQDKTDTAPAS